MNGSVNAYSVSDERMVKVDKKKMAIIAVVISLLILGLYFVFKPKPLDDKIETLMDDMQSYVLKGDMEITKGEDVKGYALEVGYLKKKKDDYFKVSITDKELNQTQVILRNKEGVYVLTPTLNQVFKFEGDWPVNSLKPYLLQSMVQIMQSKDCTKETNDNHLYVTSKVNYPNNANFKLQEMLFDEDGKIQNLQIKDANDAVQLKIVFNKVSYNTSLKTSYFALPDSMNSQVSAPVVSNDDLPLYPMKVYDSTLSNTKQLEISDGTSHVLEYVGDKNFTILESVKEKKDSMQTVIVSGTLVDTVEVFGFFDGNHMTLMKDGVEYTIYSDDLTPEEMVEVLSSMQVVVMK